MRNRYSVRDRRRLGQARRERREKGEQMITYTLTVQVDLHEGERRVNPERLARAVYHALTWTQENDIAGAEILDSRWEQISVTPGRISLDRTSPPK